MFLQEKFLIPDVSLVLSACNQKFNFATFQNQLCSLHQTCNL